MLVFYDDSGSVKAVQVSDKSDIKDAIDAGDQANVDALMADRFGPGFYVEAVPDGTSVKAGWSRKGAADFQPVPKTKPLTPLGQKVKDGTATLDDVQAYLKERDGL
jgi:hypothetical protein